MCFVNTVLLILVLYFINKGFYLISKNQIEIFNKIKDEE